MCGSSSCKKINESQIKQYASELAYLDIASSLPSETSEEAICQHVIQGGLNLINKQMNELDKQTLINIRDRYKEIMDDYVKSMVSNTLKQDVTY